MLIGLYSVCVPLKKPNVLNLWFKFSPPLRFRPNKIKITYTLVRPGCRCLSTIRVSLLLVKSHCELHISGLDKAKIECRVNIPVLSNKNVVCKFSVELNHPGNEGC